MAKHQYFIFTNHFNFMNFSKYYFNYDKSNLFKNYFNYFLIFLFKINYLILFVIIRFYFKILFPNKLIKFTTSYYSYNI
jgi:hypothetical protein